MDKKTAAELRKQIRQQRRALTPQQQCLHGQLASGYLQAHPAVQQAQHVGLYLPCDGELNLTRLRHWLLQRGAMPWLPVLQSGGLAFRPWSWRTPMQANRYGIKEPLAGPSLPVEALDILILPLVAADRQGNRLGMGAGWYDRTLAPCYKKQICPWLVGAAHELQMVEALQPQPWDIPLQALVSERGLIEF